MTRNHIDWKEVYESYDGSMPECLGGGCPTPCCTPKTVRIWNGPQAEYYTTMEPSELRAQIEMHGNLPEGVEATRADIGAYTSGIKILIKGCLGKKGECLMEGRKPYQCRLFPFKAFSTLPLDTSCPRSSEIASNSETVEGIRAMRIALNLAGDEEWAMNLVKHLSS